MTIFKFHLGLSGEVEMPKGAKILTVQTQKNEPYIWALVEPKMPKETRRFITLSTGYDASMVISKPYIGTFLLDDEELVFHVFELSAKSS